MGQNLPCFTHGRQTGDDQGVPEEEIEQKRHIAQCLDIEKRQKSEQRIARETGDADDQPDDRREHDAPGRNPNRVDDAGQEGTTIGVGGLVVDECLADDEAGLSAQKVEACGNVLLSELLRDVGKQIKSQKDDACDGDYLVEDGAEAEVVEKPRPARRIDAHDDPFRNRLRAKRAAIKAARLISDYRKGGE